MQGAFSLECRTVCATHKNNGFKNYRTILLLTTEQALSVLFGAFGLTTEVTEKKNLKSNISKYLVIGL